MPIILIFQIVFFLDYINNTKKCMKYLKALLVKHFEALSSMPRQC